MVQPCDLFEQELSSPWQNTTCLKDLKVGVKQKIRVRTLHGEGLSRTCLAISKDACVLAIEHSLDEWLHFLEDLKLSCVLREHNIEVVKTHSHVVFSYDAKMPGQLSFNLLREADAVSGVRARLLHLVRVLVAHWLRSAKDSHGAFECQVVTMQLLSHFLA